jgi:recombination protein RecA
MVNPDAMKDIIAAAEKKYGENIIHKSSEFQRILRIPFDSIEMNVATGGGVPVGRWSRFWGGESSGKSTNALKIIKNAQNIHVIAEQMLECDYEPIQREAERILDKFPEGMSCAYYNIEKSFDRIYAEKIGVDTDKLWLVEASEIESVGEILQAALDPIDLHVIDSVSAAVPLDASEADIADWQRGLNARVWQKVLEHVEPKVEEGQNTIVLIDQVRQDMFTGGEKVSGGKRLNHVSSMTVHFKRGKDLYMNKQGALKPEKPKDNATLSGEPEPVGYEMLAHVRKSRVGTAQRKAKLDYVFEKQGSDRISELAKASYWLGFVEVGGSWFTLPDGSKVQGFNNLREKIEEDIVFQKQIQDRIYQYYYENP